VPRIQIQSLIILLLLSLSYIARAQPIFWRAIWDYELEDEKTGKPLTGRAREKRIQLLEDAYGAKLFIMKDEGPTPKKPKKVPGVVFHDSIYDRKYVVGDINPQLDSNRMIKKINKQYGLKDIDEKWDEYNFLKQFVPEMVPPEMHLASDYTQPVKPNERESAKEKLKVLIKKYESESAGELIELAKKNDEDLIRLLTIQDRINNAPGMGRSILKIRNANHSEGKLPKTDKDWGDLYLHYLQVAKPQINDETSAEDLLHIPHASGRVLDFMLGKEPQSVIVQHMVKIKREVRVHIMNSHIIDGASFLRFYQLNEYLQPEELQKIQETLEKYLLAPARAKGFNHICASPDVAILEDGTIKILDFNDGNYSGYLQPTEDLFTTNLLAEKISGNRTKFLKEFDEFAALPLGQKKIDALRHLTQKYEMFLTGDVGQAFWDRIGKQLMTELAKDPSPERYDKILWLMRRGGLNSKVKSAEWIYMQFVAEAQDRWPALTLPKAKQQAWATYIDKLDSDAITYIDKDGHFVNAEIEEPVQTCLTLKRVGLANP